MYTGDYVAGRDETVAPYYVGVYQFWREAWEARAKAMGYEGLLMLRGYVPPIKNDVYWSPDGPAMNPNGSDWATLVWSFKCVWDSFDYGGHGLDYLEEQVYPSLRGIADFFASLVKLGEDGHYHIDRSQIREEPDTLVRTSVFSHPAWLIHYAQLSGEGDFRSVLPLETQAQKAIASWLEPERLCNSRSGTIHLFPAVPGDFDVAFRDFQARGGFLVSAELRGGTVTHARIAARRAGPCRVMNPWPDRELRVVDAQDDSPVETVRDGERYEFPSVAGRRYRLSPDPANATVSGAAADR